MTTQTAMMIVRVLASSPPDELSGLEVGDTVVERLFADDVGADDVDRIVEELALDDGPRLDEVVPVVVAAALPPPSTVARPPTWDMKPSRLFDGTVS